MAELLCLKLVTIAFRYLSENRVLNQNPSTIIVKNDTECTAVVSRICFCEGNGNQPGVISPFASKYYV